MIASVFIVAAPYSFLVPCVCVPSKTLVFAASPLLLLFLRLPGAHVNGRGAERLPNTLSVTLPGLRGESIVLALDQKGVSASAGSACHSGSPKPSHVLLAAGLSEEEAQCTVRFSLGPGNTAEEIERVLKALRDVIVTFKSSVRSVPCR